MADESIIETVQRFLRKVRESGIHARRAVLFGSCARGDCTPESDIDVLVIAPEFDGQRDPDKVRLLWRARANVDIRLEPLACGERQWLEDDGTPLIEIARQQGVMIELGEEAAVNK